MPFTLKDFLSNYQPSAQQGMKGEQDRQAAEAQRAQNMEAYQRLRAGDPRAAIGVSGEGNISVNPEDPLATWLKQMQVQQGFDDRLDKKVENMGKRVEQADIPGAAQAVNELESALPPEGQPLRSYGPVLNAVPDSLVALGERFGFLPKGASSERQAMAAGKALIRKPIFGQSLTKGEQESAEAAFGAPIGGSEEQLRSTVRRLGEIPITALENIESSTAPKAVGRYQGQGGLSSKKMREKRNLRTPVSPQDKRKPPANSLTEAGQQGSGDKSPGGYNPEWDK